MAKENLKMIILGTELKQKNINEEIMKKKAVEIISDNTLYIVPVYPGG